MSPDDRTVTCSTCKGTVKPEELVPGFYVAFGSDLGVVGFFRVKDHSAQYAASMAHHLIDMSGADPLVIWGLSRWRGRIAYRTRGCPLAEWLARQPPGVQFRRDRDRTGWPLDVEST